MSKDIQELHMCLWNTDVPGGKKVKIWQNILHFDPAHPQGCVMSLKCEQPLD